MIAWELKASVGFLERYLFLLRRYIGWELVFLTYQVVNALTIALIGVSSGDGEAVLYLTVGALVWGYLSLTFNEVSALIAWERWEVRIEYTLIAPVRRATHLLSNCVGAVAYGLVRTVVVLLAVAVFLGIDLSAANLPAVFVVLVVSSLSFIGLGLLAAVLPLLSPERGTQATHIVQALILLVSGVYYEVTVLPAWLQHLSWLSPATYTLRAMRAALLEGAGLDALGGTVALLAGMGAVLIPLGLWVFSLGEDHARRHGGLARNG